MSQIQSNSSYALSAIQFNSKSLNPLDSINPGVVNKIKREGDGYVGCSSKCIRIWESLSKNDIAGSHLTQNVIQVIFKQFQTDFYALTKISSMKQFMKIFDQDKDGCLNSDEQIQIFSFIKQRLELVANNCLQIQAYIKFETLMKEVRLMEANIAKWQDQLRHKVHSNQISQYRKEGETKIDEFCDQFDQQFEELQNTMLHRRQNFQKRVYYETQALEERLGKPGQYIKIKPKNRLKQLQFQQKLVSLEQRVYQAIDFRKQLNELQILEKDRVDKLMMEHAQQQRQNLAVKHQRQRKQLQIKLEELQNKLIIKMKKEFEILRKKNNLHETEIRRLQGLEKKWAERKGIFEPELKRTKNYKKQRNDVLGEYKRSMIGKANVGDDICDQGKQTSNKFNAKAILNSTIKFKLANRLESELPVNKKNLKVENNYNNKINKYIDPKNSQKTYSLCKFYNTNLQEEKIKPVISQQLLEQEKARKYQFTMTKLL